MIYCIYTVYVYDLQFWLSSVHPYNQFKQAFGHFEQHGTKIDWPNSVLSISTGNNSNSYELKS